jgi:hypothetical protein
LIVIIVLLVGFIGYYIWHSNQQTDKTLSTAKTTAVTSFADCKKAAGSILQESYPEKCVTKDGKSFTDPLASPVTSYLTIKEWGVRAPFSGTPHLEYEYTAPDSDGVSNVHFSSSELDAFGGICQSGKNYGGAIVRYPADAEFQLEAEGSGQTAAAYIPAHYGSNYSKVGNYYFVYASPQAACGDNQAALDAQDEATAAVRTLANTIEAAPTN